MGKKRILQIFRETGALQKGHFVLTSGLHSDTYFQCARVLQHPRHAERLCSQGKIFFAEQKIDTVIAPALGGIIVGYELARQLGARSIFAERQAGIMMLRRGFALQPEEKVIVTEDVVTTGGSVGEVVQLARAKGAEVLGIFTIVDRSEGRAHFDVPFYSILNLQAEVYEPESCPLCQKGLPVTKPGSRERK